MQSMSERLDYSRLRAPRNRTIDLSREDRQRLRLRFIEAASLRHSGMPPIGTILGDSMEIVKLLPESFVDLLILDPPYNLNKTFNGLKFNKLPVKDYTSWLDSVVVKLRPLLKNTASIYICGDWHTSASIFEVASKHFVVRNRITWEREKGRGAKSNWKNSSEDIWFCTMSEEYAFNVAAVKLRRKVIAPYRNADGLSNDWRSTENGGFRDTHPSNIW